MTSFSDLILRESDRAAALRGARPVARAVAEQGGSNSGEQAWWKTALHAAGKVEEITAKALGSVLTDDSRFDNVFGESTFDSQVGFSHLAESLGANEENLGASAPFVQAAVGIGAAIANPFDPLNKLRVLGLTKKGHAGQALRTAGKAALKEIDGSGRKLFALDRGTLTERLATAQKQLGAATPENQKHLKRTIKGLNRSLQDLDDNNRVLLGLQKAGASIDDIMLAPTMHEQAVRGQRKFLGFTSPTRLDQLSLLGLGRSADSQSVRLPALPKAIDTALIKAGSKIWKGAAIPIGRGFKGAIAGLTGQVATTAKGREVDTLIRQTMASMQQGNVDEVQRNLESIYRSSGLNQEELHEILDTMEGTFQPSEVRTAKQALSDLLIKEPDALSIRAASDVKLGTEDDASSLVGRSRLTDDQKILMTPSGLDQNDVARAMDQLSKTSFPMRTVGAQGQHEARILGDYVVLQAGPGKAQVGDISELDPVFGQPIWRRHETPDGVFLIQRRLPQAVPVGKSGTLTPDHLENLENIAAQLATKKRTLNNLTSSDILVTPYGGVQIINPDVIQQAKGASSAAQNSAITLDRLADQLNIPMGPSREFHSLKNGGTAKRVTKGVDGMRFRVAGAANEVAEADDDLLYIGGYDLLDEAGNGGPYRDFLRGHAEGIEPQALADQIGDLRDFDRANGIDAERRRLRSQVRSGKQPMIEPIEIMVSPDGRLEITNGRNRVAAALMEGLDIVPIKRVGWMGETANAANGYYTGSTRAIDDVFRDSGPLARDGFYVLEGAADGSTKSTRHPSMDLVSGDYKLVSPGGQFAKVTPDDLNIPSSERVLGVIDQLTTMGPEMTRGRSASRVEQLARVFEKQFGSRQAASVKLAEMIEASDSAASFLEGLEEVTKFSFSNSMRPGVLQQANQNFGQIVRPAASDHLDELARRGVLTDVTVQQPQRRALASESLQNTVIHSDPQSNTLTLSNSLKTADELKKTAEDLINSGGDASEIQPFAKVALESQDALPTNLEAKDFVTRPHPLLRNTFTPAVTAEFTPDRVAALKAKGILINPSTEDLNKVGLTSGVLLGRSEDARGLAQFSRPNFPYFVTRSGEMIVHTADKTEDVRTLLHEVFGEASQFYQEFGIIGAGRITVSNPLGGLMSKIGKAETGLLERRLKELSRRFEDMGLSGSTVVRVLPPFEEGIWNQMYGARRTISDITSDEFKLKIPKILEGHVPDHVVQDTRFLGDGDAGQVAFKTETVRVKDAKVRAVLDELRDLGDEQFYQEALAGLPTSYHEGYAARNLTPEASEALNDAALKWQKQNSGTQIVQNLESFFKGRMFTDLTTREINAMVKKLQDGGAKDPAAFIGDILKTFRKEAEVNEQTARKLYGLAQALPHGTDLFLTDPIYTTALRYRLGQQALARKEIFDQLADKHVVWSGTVEDWRKMRGGKSEADRLGKEMETLEGRISQDTADLQALEDQTTDIASAAKDELATKIEKNKAKYGRLDTQRATAMQAWQKGSAIAGDVDWDSQSIYVAGEDARKMVGKGDIDPADITGDTGDLLVKVPFGKYTVALEENATRVALFTPEVAQTVDRYFGTTTKTGFSKFLQFYDSVLETWKSWTLFPIPSYHARNTLSNSFMAWLGGVTTTEPYRDAFKVFKVMRQHRLGKITRDGAAEALDSMQFANPAGQVVTAREMYGEFIKHGGLSGGLHFNEFNRFSGGLKRSSTFDRTAVNKGIVPSSAIAGASLLNNPAIRGGIATASVIENHYRFAAFVDAWQKGTSINTGSALADGFEAAGLHMKRVFYDYSDLSMFERDVLKRFLPFYSWSRHNIPRMLQTMVTKPTVHLRVSQMINNMERGAAGPDFNREEELPDWVRDRFGMVVAKRKDGSYWVRTAEGVLPMTDAYKMLAGDGISETITNGLVPFIKVPIEQLTNLSLYTQRPIEQFEGQRARSFTLGAAGLSRRVSTEGPLSVANTILNESLFTSTFRAGNEVVKILDTLLDDRSYTKEKGTVTTALIGLLIGRSYLIDPEKTRAMVYRDWTSRINKMKSMHKYYQSVGDVRAAQDTLNMLNWLVLQNAPSDR